MADNSIVETIKAVGSIVTPIVVAYIALLQIKMAKKQDTIAVKVDGMTEKLVTAEKEGSRLKGREEQRAETKAETVQAIKIEAAVTDEDAKKVADTVVETVKKDPDIEIKKS